MYFVSYAERLFLVETSTRAGHGNFLWGCFFFTGALQIVCLTEWISIIKSGKLSFKNPILYIGSIVYLLNVIFGFHFMAFNMSY